MVNPRTLIENGIRLVKNSHKQNEFMISRARAYHSGFNFGYNLAEAVNFGLTDWLNIGNNVGFCRCVNYSVSINMRKLYKQLKLNPKKYLDDS